MLKREVNMVSKKRAESPSWIKYDAAKPVISFRTDKELDERLEAVKKTEGKSNADVMRDGVGLNEVKIKSEAKIRQEAYDQGWEKGIDEAFEVFVVTYPCSKCGKEITVDSPEEKKAIRKYMREHRWCHVACINRK
jgi:hypothetical protein